MKQNMAALREANERRLARAALRAEVERLERTEALGVVAALIENPPVCIYSLEAFDLIQWCYRIGRRRALDYCRSAGVSELGLTGYLTERQRRALCSVLRGEEMEAAA